MKRRCAGCGVTASGDELITHLIDCDGVRVYAVSAGVTVEKSVTHTIDGLTTFDEALTHAMNCIDQAYKENTEEFHMLNVARVWTIDQDGGRFTWRVVINGSAVAPSKEE